MICINMACRIPVHDGIEIGDQDDNQT